MCVILLSEKGKNAPTEKQIKQAFDKNPDGAGFAYCDKRGKVKFEKGFMCVEDLLNRLKPLDQWTNTTLAIHFRIGTAGKNDAKTCHPFRISTKFGELRQTSGEGPVLFHNGILSKGGLIDPLSSDTQDFVAAYAPMLAKYNKSKARDAFIEDAVTGSRILIMYDNNKIKLYGDWKKSDEGDLLVSNKLWEYTPYYSYGGYYKPYGYSVYDPKDDLSDEVIDKAFNITNSTSSTTASTPTTSTSTSTQQTLLEPTKFEVDEAWKTLAKNKFIWFDDEEMFEALLNSADEISGDMVTKDGVMYMFSWEEMAAWDASLDGYMDY